ncbi:DoxX family protein [Olivibacter domesticus]|uniref:DoxX-like family protein n=1 Tax=Olivibacter domesticus TaxID=407022 RepID=A0A1H7GH29_OLID1|nr:DoxX family protein [Olivibacter domesticus]SEK37419.1 DoxX-like family protein [Olivibacter domesticus]
MNTKTTKIIYWSGIIFMSLWFGASGYFELTKNPIVWGITQQLGYPPHFIYLLGVFKLSGIMILLIPNKLLRLKEWVFAGMFFDIVFAFFSKISVIGFPATIDALLAFSILTIAYIQFRKLYPFSYTLFFR